MADGLMIEAPAGGRFDGRRHLLSIRVYYEDTDAGGIVYHANYLRFAERARTEMMRLAGIGHTELMAEHGVMFAVHRCSIEFHRPARLDDALVVTSEIAATSAATLTIEQQILRASAPDQGPAAPGTKLASLRLRLVLLDRQLRPARLPPALRDVLSEYL